MKKNWWTDTSKANWVDYAISWLASALAAFSCGQAVGSDQVSGLGVLFVTVGTLISFLIRSLTEKANWTKVAGTLYSLAAWGAILGVMPLNTIVFPPETFPRELMPSSWLFWMISFGTLFLWRDGVLIFHTIPPLAMFGFVGCYDTFRPVVALFFLFLVCFAILFSRAHARDMQVRAAQSGFFKVISNVELPAEHQSEILRDGPWRWAAGAEWALGSALIIVVLSALGAPVIQATAKPISGLVPIRTPRIRSALTNSSGTARIQAQYSVGTGSVNLSDRPYFEVTGDLGRYYRVTVFSRYGAGQWIRPTIDGPKAVFDRKTLSRIPEDDTELTKNQLMPGRIPGQLPTEYRSRQISVTSLFPIDEVPQLGNNPTFRGDTTVRTDDYGVGFAASPAKYRIDVQYDPASKVTPVNAPRYLSTPLSGLLDNGTVVLPRLSKLAVEVTKGLKTDYEKMSAIQRAVSQRIRYNTKVARTPEGSDPAEHALFDAKEGYCDVFATAVTLMGREVGIPVRYVVGYLADPKNKNDEGTQMLLESDRHAWAEAYFENVGWVVFDATEGAEVVPGGDRRSASKDQDSTRRTIELILNGAIAISVIGGVAAFIKARSAAPTSQQIRAELDKNYLLFISGIWRLTGQRRLLSETTSEYVGRLADKLGEHQAGAQDLEGKFTSIMFRRQPVTSEEVATLGSEVQNFVKLLRSTKPAR